LREGLANAWQTMVAAELFASSEGLGYMITLGRQLFQFDMVLAVIVVLGVVGLVVNGALALVERRLLRWQGYAA
jgi:sulfonate transport system permease protein